MKRKIKSSQTGAISVFVMITMVFFLLTIVGVYMISSKRAQTQTESVKLVQDQYYTENEENDVYLSKIADSSAIIPIYTKEQLWSIGTGKAIEIEGKVYNFDTGSAYELKNDIVINIETDLANSKIPSGTINKNNFDIFYYYKENYYKLVNNSGVTVESGTAILSASGENFANITETTTGVSGKYYLFALANPVNVTFDYNYLENNLFTRANNPDNYGYNAGSTSARTTIADASGLEGKALEFTMNNSTGGSTGPYVGSDIGKLTVGKKYTWSVYVKTSSNKSNMIIGHEQNGGKRDFTITTQWQRITHTFTASDVQYNAFVVYGADNSTWSSGDKLYIRSLELAETDSLNVATYEKAYNSTLSGILLTPTRAGYTFLGWYTDPIEGEKVTEETKVPKEDVTYYAHWSYNGS